MIIKDLPIPQRLILTEILETRVSSSHKKPPAIVKDLSKRCCPVCKNITKDIDRDTVNDYFSLIKPWITNSEFREFAQLPSDNVAGKRLRALNLQITGTTKNRQYHL